MSKYIRKSGKIMHTSRQRCECSEVFSAEKTVSCQQKVWTEGEEDWKGGGAGRPGETERKRQRKVKRREKGRRRGEEDGGTRDGRREGRKREGGKTGRREKGKRQLKRKSNYEPTWPTVTVTESLRRTCLPPYGKV